SPCIAIIRWGIAPQGSHSAHEPSGPFGVDSRAENFRMSAKHALISRDDPQAPRRFFSRQRAISDQKFAQKNDVVVFAQNAVERFDPPLVGDEMIAAPPLEQAAVEPVILHVAPPRVKMRRLRLRPRRDHHPPGTTIALLEAWRDCPKTFTANAPSLDAAPLAAQGSGGDLEDSARVRVVIGASAVAEHSRAGGGERL